MVMKGERLFPRLLLTWNRQSNKRKMPWKGEKDPYKVWLSEVILQQTRVEQGWKYYEKFIAKYPTIKALAAASDETVFKLWEGLGYYSRCRNLLHTARLITEKYNGNFPDDYESIVSLKGVGSYTASAIASFCFGLPYAVVDGNVLRVMSRFFGIDKPVDTAEGKKFFAGLAQVCMDKNDPGKYNQAIMDFGATICKPIPVCDLCPLKKACVSFRSKQVSNLPVVSGRLQRKERWFSYFILMANGRKFVRQRTEKDIWRHLNEFYLSETPSDPKWTLKKIRSWLRTQLNVDSIIAIRIIPANSQVLTHRIVHGYFIEVELLSVPPSLSQEINWITRNEIRKKAFPRFIHQYLLEKKPALRLFPPQTDFALNLFV